MYNHYFHLKGAPFSIAPDPRYLFMSERHREALAHLLYGIGSGGGFVLLTGEIGAGKTTVCRCFIEQIPDNCRLAYIFNPRLSVEELLQSVCDELRIALPPAQGPLDGAPGIKGYVDAINRYLLEAHAQGLNNVADWATRGRQGLDVIQAARTGDIVGALSAGTELANDVAPNSRATRVLNDINGHVSKLGQVQSFLGG